MIGRPSRSRLPYLLKAFTRGRAPSGRRLGTGAIRLAARVAMIALLVTIVTIRVRREDLSGVAPAPPEVTPPPAGPQPELQPAIVGQQDADRAALAAAVRPCRLC